MDTTLVFSTILWHSLPKESGDLSNENLSHGQFGHRSTWPWYVSHQYFSTNKITLALLGISVTAADAQCEIKVNFPICQHNISKAIDALENSTACLKFRQGVVGELFSANCRLLFFLPTEATKWRTAQIKRTEAEKTPLKKLKGNRLGKKKDSRGGQ